MVVICKTEMTVLYQATNDEKKSKRCWWQYSGVVLMDFEIEQSVSNENAMTLRR